MIVKFKLILCLVLLLPGVCWGHDNYVPVGAGNGQLLVGTVFAGALQEEPFGLYSNNPGFEVALPLYGIPAGTLLELDVLSELVYWDGNQLADTEVTLAVESPTVLQQFDVSAGSQAQLGLPWGIYPETKEAWHLDGSYLLTSPSGTFEPGMYGVTVRLNSPSFAPSEPFSLSFLFDEANVLTPSQESEGRLAFTRVATDPQAGDYHLDEFVDGHDHTRWSTDFGKLLEEPSTGADGSGDGFVGLADYTLWRDNLSAADLTLADAAAAGPLAVPEPSTIGILTLQLILVFAGTFAFSRQTVGTLRHNATNDDGGGYAIDF